MIHVCCFIFENFSELVSLITDMKVSFRVGIKFSGKNISKQILSPLFSSLRGLQGFHIPQIFKLSGKIKVFGYIFAFVYFHFMCDPLKHLPMRHIKLSTILNCESGAITC